MPSPSVTRLAPLSGVGRSWPGGGLLAPQVSLIAATRMTMTQVTALLMTSLRLESSLSMSILS